MLASAVGSHVPKRCADFRPGMWVCWDHASILSYPLVLCRSQRCPHNCKPSAKLWSFGLIRFLVRAYTWDVCWMQRLDGSSSSLGASPKSSSGYLHSNSLSSDVEDLQSPSSANGSLPHLEVGQLSEPCKYHSRGMILQIPIN